MDPIEPYAICDLDALVPRTFVWGISGRLEDSMFAGELVGRQEVGLHFMRSCASGMWVFSGGFRKKRSGWVAVTALVRLVHVWAVESMCVAWQKAVFSHMPVPTMGGSVLSHFSLLPIVPGKFDKGRLRNQFPRRLLLHDQAVVRDSLLGAD